MAAQAPVISHVLFADDVILFTKASKAKAKALFDIINYYFLSTGQLVNIR